MKLSLIGRGSINFVRPRLTYRGNYGSRNNEHEEWFLEIEKGRITLPRFQRHQAWKQKQIKGVLENILRNPPLPIGALLVLEVGSEQLFHSRPISGAPKPRGKPRMNLLDGQQRMTALWKSLNDLYQEPSDDLSGFKVFVSLPIGNENPQIEIIRPRYMKNGACWPQWADEAKKCLKKRQIPISILRPGNEGEKKKEKWLCDAKSGGLEDTSVRQVIGELRDRLASYLVPHLSLPDNTKRETALEVFIKMNTSVAKLNDFDIVVAHLERDKKIAT